MTVKAGRLPALVGDLWRHLSLIRKRELKVLISLMLLTSFAEVFSIGMVLPFLSALMNPNTLLNYEVIKRITIFFHVETNNQLVVLIATALALGSVIAGTLRLLLLRFTGNFACKAGVDLSLSIYKKTLYQPYFVHISHNSSELINSIFNKSGDVIYQVIMPLLQCVTSIILLLVIVAGLMILNPLLTVNSLMAMGFIYGALAFFSKERYRRNSGIVATESTNAIRSIHEGMGGIRDVIIDGSQEIYCHIYQGAITALRQAQANNLFLANSPRFILETFGLVTIAFVTIFLSKNPNGILFAIPVLGVIAMSAQKILPLIQQLYASWAAIKGGQASLEDVLALLNQRIPDLPVHNASVRLPFSKQIQVQNVSFRYGSNTSNILMNLSIKIDKGSRVGIVGKTGAGKSTLLDLIMGLLVPTSGVIKIDDVLLSNANRHSWQRCIAHVPQVVFLADSSIKNNIIFGSVRSDLDMKRLIEVTRQAQLLEFIESLPRGFDTPIGERGVRLSGGQRQRIGIARALYRQADVLILDEATNALDHKTELEVMNAIESLDRDITIIMIAHRATTLDGCDQIIDIGSY